MVKLVRHDLEFILDQIEIAETHSAAIATVDGSDAISQIGDALRELVDSPLIPGGLRTVDGSYNNLVPGREKWGASGEPFPRLSQPNWVNENDDSIVFGAGSPGQTTFTDGNYGQNGAPSGPGGLGGGTLVDADPRIISNLIVDQTLGNPAVIAAALRLAGHSEAAIAQATQQIHAAHQSSDAQLPALLDQWGVQMDGNTVLLPNVAPDEGLSAPYNAWFTLFGQFFDHGLDLVKKGGNGTVYIPLQPDDPLYDSGSPHTNFMVLTRASIGGDAANVTTPWVDQNQTYTSHASHQVFLREYALGADGRPFATGNLLEGRDANGQTVPHTLATWKDVKDQARAMLGIELTDADVGMVPLLRTDPYGRFIPDATTGFAQVITGVGPDGVPNTADDIVVSGTPDAPASLANAIRTPNAFLDDIAHSAVPGTTYDHDNNPMTPGVQVQADADDVAGNTIGVDGRGNKVAYDDELLDKHYVTGDGRGNENIGLTAVHFVFHAEHNRQVEQIKETVLATGDADFIAEWQLEDGSWNGERLFQAARFATEMQYQHLVFEEFARKIQPDVDIFLVEPDVELNPAIFSEFANVVYRFGHSMLNQTVDRIYADGTRDNIDLFDAFLNPMAFGEAGVSQAEMAGALALGMSAQHANEIDEFVTDVLRNQLVGIPLDLAALNIARGRDTGMPTLNQARAEFQDLAHGDTLLRPYTSWADFALNLRNPESIINFIAAYGRHATVESALTVEAKRDAAMELVFGTDVNGDGSVADDRLAFLNATGAYAGGTLGGLNEVDLWIGGLAEKKMAFGGMLGSTFSFIFQLQMENLQDADRFYYLSRTQGLNLLTELENNSLAKMIKRNTSVEEDGLALPADVFSTPDHTLYMDFAKQMAITGLADPVHDNPVLQAVSSLVERVDADADGVAEYIRYNGLDHIVIQGTDGNDHIVSGGGDDTVWGGEGDDRIEAGYGVDAINGGAGDDIITSAGTDIGAVSVLKGESGDDVIVDGTGMSLIFGGEGKDYLVSGADDGEIRGGQGDDFIFGGDGMGMLFGNEGDDWIEGGGGFDFIAGDNAELFFNSTVIGHDVINGGQGDTDYDADSGDDIMVAGEGIEKNIGMWGHDWVIHQGQATAADADMRVDIFTTLPLEVLRDRFSQVEGLSGWNHDDTLRGDDRAGNGPEGGNTTDPTPEAGFRYNELNQAAIDRIDGLSDLITPDLMAEGEYWADGSWESGQAGTREQIFVGGNILLGGGGSDTIEGRGGDDIIDGDRHLNVRISIRANEDGTGAEIATVGSMTDSVTLGGVTKALSSWMVDGTINPGQLQIVRELLDGGQDDDLDTAVYWDVRANYEITPNADGSITVAHVTQTVGAIDPETGRNRVSDGVDRLHNIEQLQFADGLVSLTRPELYLQRQVGQYADNFNAGGLGNSTGTTNWGPDWVEVGDSGGVTTGQIRIDAGGQGGSNALVFHGGTNAADHNGATITRTVDLSAASSATLTYSANPDNLDTGEWVRVFFAADGVDFVPLNEITGNGGTTNYSHPLTGPFQANAAIRFEVSALNQTNEIITIDNLAINFTSAPTVNYTATYTEDGADQDIASNPLIVAGDEPIVSARIVLTNAQPGDDFDIPGNLPGNIDSSIDRSVPGRIVVTLSGDESSIANWEDALQAVEFFSTSENPNSVQRVIEVTVNNGLFDSMVAVTRINVVAVDDPVEAGNDTIITNISGTTSIVVPKWALLANDVDPDSPISITGVSGANGLSNLAHNASSVSFTDPTTGGGAQPGGSFTYTATGAPGDTDTATVNVARDTTGSVDGTTGNNILIGGEGASTFDGGTGNDIVLAGGGDDSIVWNANNFGATDGRDFVDGGAGNDEFVVNGNNASEAFVVYARAAADADGITGLRSETEIVITRNGTVIAELDGIEEIVINTGQGTDSVTTRGNFNPTSLSFNTITINGSEGDDTVDISTLTSAHRIVFRSNGGNDTIIGALRAQDVVELPAGSDPADFERSYDDETGLSTLSDGDHAIVFSGDFDPVLRVRDEDDRDDDDDTSGSEDDDDQDHDDEGTPGSSDSEDEDEDDASEDDGDDRDDDEDEPTSEEDDDSGETGCGCDDEDDDSQAPPTGQPGAGSVRTGTAQADVLVGTAGDDSLVGLAGDDTLIGRGGDDVISAGAGDDFAEAGEGDDIVFLGSGDDLALGGAGHDALYGEAGADRLLGGTGNDRLEGGAGDDAVIGGSGNDLFVATVGDGNDTYHGDDLEGGAGTDTLDMSAISASVTVNLGTGLLGRGSASSSQSGYDTLWSIENVATGSGDDVITASTAVNVMEGGAGDDTFRFTSAEAADGDTILDFEPGDRLDLSAIDADGATDGNQSFTLVSGGSFTASAQLAVTYETRADGEYTVVSGNTGGGQDADFQLSLKGTHSLNNGNVIL